MLVAYAAGDRRIGRPATGSMLATDEWWTIEMFDPVPTSCYDHPDRQATRVREFDHGAFVVEVNRDQVTGQWVAHFLEDLPGV